MMGANHAITGAAAWVAATSAMPAIEFVSRGFDVSIPLVTGLYVQDPTVVLGGAIIAAGAALLPDADHHSATIAHSVPIIGKIATAAIGAASGGHRKGTHTVWAVIGVLALSMLLRFAQWDTGTFLGTVCIGAGLAATALTAFAGKVIKSLALINSWPKAWVFGAAMGFITMVVIPGDQTWLPVAITLGMAVHIAGDMLTTGGVAPLYPLVPKPPIWWQQIPVLNRIWQGNGYIGLPVLGNTGSLREMGLGLAVTVYVLYAVAFETTGIFGLDLPQLLAGSA